MTDSSATIAIIGSGIAGLTVAAGLHGRRDFIIYEAQDWIGGHTHTVEVEEDGHKIGIDTGFIVCNEWTYPNFLALLARHGITTQRSDMSFSVCDEHIGLEYNGTNLDTLFAQRRNMISPGFLGMIYDILKFNRSAPSLLTESYSDLTLGEWLKNHGYGQRFINHYIVPMGRSIWSAREDALLKFPVRFFVDFFHRHGFLNINNRPIWQVIPGGSSSYVRAITARFRDRILTGKAVQSIHRLNTGVSLLLADGTLHQHTEVVIATHADSALAILQDPTDAERAVLGAFPFEANDVTLHTDVRQLPTRARARAAWNFRIRGDRDTGCSLTYDMNVLQSLKTKRRYLVSLNLTDRIDPSAILGRWNYDHPVYTPAAVAAQSRHDDISGQRHTYYAGAYWRYGFHEDGVVSGLRVLDQMGIPRS
jgi:predicted NAD/FAD-binding protein